MPLSTLTRMRLIIIHAKLKKNHDECARVRFMHRKKSKTAKGGLDPTLHEFTLM